MRPIAWRAAIFCSSSCGTAAMRRTPRDTGMKPAKNPNDEYQGMSLISSYIILYHIISYYIVLYCIILYVCMYIYIYVCVHVNMIVDITVTHPKYGRRRGVQSHFPTILFGNPGASCRWPGVRTWNRGNRKC